MNFITYLPFFAGMGLFLYGMTMMSHSLEKIAGARLEKMLERLTSNRVKGALLGTAVTAVIQSSAATTVMLIGFVNAGIMKLTQAIPVIMGANIGTTVTAQILRLGDISSDNIVVQLLKPSIIAPIMIFIGTMLYLFTRRQRAKDIGSMIFGLGAIFFGMTVMENAFAPLADSPAIAATFTTFNNPVLGIIIGAVVTALIQSSTASVGLLQALCSTGLVPWSMGVPIIMGQNIGTCVTAILASIGASHNAKRTAAAHLLFNMFGTVLFSAAIFGYNAIVGIPQWFEPLSRGNVADFHTIFNLTNTVLLLPLTGVFAKCVTILIPDKNAKAEESLLEERFLATPALALEQCRKVLLAMGSRALENFDLASGLFTHFDPKAIALLEENENFIDRSETLLDNYMVKVTSRTLSDESSRFATEILHSITDFERIGDYCINVFEVAEFNNNNGIEFSEEGKKELAIIVAAVRDIISKTVEAYTNNDQALATQIEPLEEIIDTLTDLLKQKHVNRLQAGKCSVQAGISYLELMTNFERISDHCSNIATYIIRYCNPESDEFDAHALRNRLHEGTEADYNRYFTDFEKQYLEPAQQI